MLRATGVTVFSQTQGTSSLLLSNSTGTNICRDTCAEQLPGLSQGRKMCTTVGVEAHFKTGCAVVLSLSGARFSPPEALITRVVSPQLSC